MWPSPRLIIDPPAPGAWNMAVDEALLIDAAESGIATLRFYEWNEPTLSLGYFQAYDQRHQHAASRACTCVRRQTGGGAIVHDREITYSIVLPPGHPSSSHSAELYVKAHDAFIQMLSTLMQGAKSGIVLRRLNAVSNSESPPQPFLCFQRRAMGDVVAVPQRLAGGDVSDSQYKDWKLLGSAQRRSRGALLQHGSLLLQKSTAAPELAGFYDVTGRDLAQIHPDRFIPGLEAALGVRFTVGNLSRNVELNAYQLANNKYGTAAWTKRR